MAMSRSFGGTSLTFSPSMRMSPAVASSSPAIMRKVVLLPQPEGPTSTTNSLSGISSEIWRTASTLSKRFTTSRKATSAIPTLPTVYLVLSDVGFRSSRHSPLRGAGGQAGDVVVHQEGVDDQRRRRRQQGPRHQHAPLVDVGADQARHRADREHLLVGAVEEGHWID